MALPLDHVDDAVELLGRERAEVAIDDLPGFDPVDGARAQQKLQIQFVAVSRRRHLHCGEVFRRHQRNGEALDPHRTRNRLLIQGAIVVVAHNKVDWYALKDPLIFSI